MSSGATLKGIERLAVFNRLRVAYGLGWELPPLLRLVSVPPGSQCLEIGTGLGWGTVGLLRTQPALAVVTTDYEAPILRRARDFIHEQQPDSRVGYVQTDAKALPFAKERFDFVVSLYVLHHAEGYRATLAEIARVLKPSGCLLMIDLMRPRFMPQLPARFAPEGILTEPQWRQHLRSSGFHIAQWRTRYFLGPLPRCSVVAVRSDHPPTVS